MKVLIISDTVEFSGAEEAIVNLGGLLSHQENVELRLCSTRFSDSRLERLAFESSLRIRQPTPRNIEGLYRALTSPEILGRMILHCRRVADDFKPDIVHSGILLSVFPGMVLHRSMRIPLVAHIHDYRLLSLTDLPFVGGSVFAPTYAKEFKYYLELAKPLNAIFGLGLRRSLLLLHNRCTGLVAVSNFVKSSMSRFLKPPIDVLYNAAYNFDKDALASRKTDIPSILYSGRLSIAKGFPIFLEAAELLLRDMDAEVHITGNGDLMPLARRFVKNHAAGAHFHGYLPANELRNLVARSHLSVHPSMWPEPCPLSVIKSVNLGTTAIGSTRGGLVEILPPKYLFKPSIDDLHSKILQFFANPRDFPPSLAVDLDPATITKQILSIYDRAIACPQAKEHFS
jgi:glycosyltransferase involved in cell wall biosynthesis